MPLSTSRAAYQDCYDIYDRALADPKGIRVLCTTHSKAQNLRHRMNYARQLQRRESQEIYNVGDPQFGISPYDSFRNAIRDDSEGNWWVYVEPYSSHGLHIEPLSDEYFEGDKDAVDQQAG